LYHDGQLLVRSGHPHLRISATPFDLTDSEQKKLLEKLLFALILAPLVIGDSLFAASLDDRIEEFRQFLQQYRSDEKIPSFSVALVKDGEIVLSEAIGWQDHDAEEPTTNATTYLVASISKTFTAATLLGMEADGHIDLDDDFTKLSDWDRRCEWLKNSGSIFGGGTLDDGTVVEPPRCNEPISLRHVLQHRVQGEPGSMFMYNPIVFGRLSNWVEENTDRSWRSWMNEYVLGPAELDTVGAGWRDPDKGVALTNLAPPFRHAPEEDDGIAPSILPNPELNASSGIIAGVLGLAKYSIALDQGKILPPELLERMWAPPIMSDGKPAAYAYGWWVQEWQGHKLVWHGGWWPDAYAGLLLKAPDDGWALIALGNTDAIHWDNPLHEAEVEKSPLAAKFLNLFVSN
jgi:CubicO group peptidase (beta-lactamase class C family)